MIIKHGKLTFEYNKITDSIYLGTNQCCEIHFKKELLKKGVKADISLEGEKIDAPFGVDYYLWLPTKDHTAPSQKQLKAGVDFINSLIKNKVKVYVHCQRGHGRAPTLVAAYLISKGKTVKQAIDFIKKKRKTIHPNKIQKSALEKFKKTLK
ncbi:MAG: dual specificity protein phosphatase family protein [Candidatus Woesearchaeota archaeon]